MKKFFQDLWDTQRTSVLIVIVALIVAAIGWLTYSRDIGVAIACATAVFVVLQLLDGYLNSTTTAQPESVRNCISFAKQDGSPIPEAEMTQVTDLMTTLNMTFTTVNAGDTMPAEVATPKETSWTFGTIGEALVRIGGLVALGILVLVLAVPTGDRPLTEAQKAARDAANRLRGTTVVAGEEGKPATISQSVMDGVSISADGKTLNVPVLNGVRWALVCDQLPEPGGWVEPGFKTDLFTVTSDGNVLTLTAKNRLGNPELYQVYSGNRPASKRSPVTNVK